MWFLYETYIYVIYPQVCSNGGVMASTVWIVGVGRSRKAGCHLGRLVTRLGPGPGPTD